VHHCRLVLACKVTLCAPADTVPATCCRWMPKNTRARGALLQVNTGITSAARPAPAEPEAQEPPLDAEHSQNKAEVLHLPKVNRDTATTPWFTMTSPPKGKPAAGLKQEKTPRGKPFAPQQQPKTPRDQRAAKH
jgi:hypothetical protein